MTTALNEHQKQLIASSCDITDVKSLLKKDIKFPHPVGIVISKKATIGRNCTIYQNVTIGLADIKEGIKFKFNKKLYPTIGNNCIIYAGAVIAGPIHIGHNVTVGANAVVLKDVPDNCTVVGAPARIVKGK